MMTRSRLPWQLAAVALALLLLPLAARANPEPDVPVRCHFGPSGQCRIEVEIDPRCFTDDPMHERYLMKADLDHREAAELEPLKKQALAAIPGWIAFITEPAQLALKPEFRLAFTGIDHAPLVKADDPVVITATWTFPLPAELKAMQIQATREARYSIVVSSFVNGQRQPRSTTLFPNELSHRLEVKRAE